MVRGWRRHPLKRSEGGEMGLATPLKSPLITTSLCKTHCCAKMPLLRRSTLRFLCLEGTKEMKQEPRLGKLRKLCTDIGFRCEQNVPFLNLTSPPTHCYWGSARSRLLRFVMISSQVNLFYTVTQVCDDTLCYISLAETNLINSLLVVLLNYLLLREFLPGHCPVIAIIPNSLEQ